MNSTIILDKKREGLVTFNSFLAEIDNEYILTNNKSFRNNLFVKFKRPDNASILYDYSNSSNFRIFSFVCSFVLESTDSGKNS